MRPCGVEDANDVWQAVFIAHIRQGRGGGAPHFDIAIRECVIQFVLGLKRPQLPQAGTYLHPHSKVLVIEQLADMGNRLATARIDHLVHRIGPYDGIGIIEQARHFQQAIARGSFHLQCHRGGGGERLPIQMSADSIILRVPIHLFCCRFLYTTLIAYRTYRPWVKRVHYKYRIKPARRQTQAIKK